MRSGLHTKPTMQRLSVLALVTCFLTGALGAQDLQKIRAHEPKVEEIIFESKELDQTRQVLVYTPANYSFNKLGYYNVIYVFDANDRPLFDATNGIVNMMADGSQDFIVVGIKSTFIEEKMYGRNHDLLPSDTKRNLGPKSGGNAEAFLAYMKNEVVPYIESNYRTLPHRTVVGHSLGGSFVVYAMLHEPELFDNYIALSPNLADDDQRLVRGLQNFDSGQFDGTKFLYLSNANEYEAYPAWKSANENAFRIVREKLVTDHFKAVMESYPEEGHRSGFVPGFTSAMRTYLDSIQPRQDLELSGETYEVTFRVEVPEEDDEVYITGNQESLGNWKPDQVRMEKTAPLERSLTLQVQDPVKVQFTQGDWESQAWIKTDGGGVTTRKLVIRPEEGAEYSFEVRDFKN